MKFHWGSPRYDTTIRFCRGSCTDILHPWKPKQNFGHQHTIERWYGVSFGSRTFIGIMLMKDSKEWRYACGDK